MHDLKRLLTSIAYAKSPEHERFVRDFEGTSKGRYVLAYLVGVAVLGGSELRASIERELGSVRYFPDDMFPALHLVVICDRAVRAGLSIPRLGELVFPAFKRARPELFAGTDVMDGFRLLEKASREDSGYYGSQ